MDGPNQKRTKEGRPRDQPALRVPDPAYSKSVTAPPLYPILNIGLGRLSNGGSKTCYPNAISR